MTAGRSKERYEANWKSLSRYRCPDWYRDAKFGIFTHWGLYCVPGYVSEKYPRWMYEAGDKTRAYHEKTWGPLNKFGYKDFIPLFKPQAFNAEAWVDLFKAAGARYYVPVAEHHDGFPMYACSRTEWNAAKMGPKRDFIRELEKATRARGMRFGVSTHRANHWRYYNYDGDLDTVDPVNAGLYGKVHDRTVPPDEAFLEDWWKRSTELVDLFHPDMLYFDFFSDTPAFRPYHARMAAYLYNSALDHGYEAVLSDKNFDHVAYPPSTIVLDFERGKADAIRDVPWQTDTSLDATSWCHHQNWKTKSATTIVHELMDIVSKNGNLLLNVGPDANGEVPADQRKVLLEIGEWLKANGEAVYGTRPWIVYGEGEAKATAGHFSEQAESPFTFRDIRFTVGERYLYATALGIPQDGTFAIRSLGLAQGNRVKSVDRIGISGRVKWTQEPGALHLSCDECRSQRIAVVFRIELA